MPTGRQRTVSEKDVEEAKRNLDVIRDHFWEETKLGERIQFFLAQSDLHFRQKNYKDGYIFASKARSKADKFGFNTEIQLANDRLQNIKQASPFTLDDGLHTNTPLDVGNPDNSTGNPGNVCVHGKGHSTRNDIPADVDAVHGNVTSDISSSDSNSQIEHGSIEGHVGDVNARSASSDESDFLNSPSYI